MRRVASQGPKFLADSMHGKLTRWLRMLGYDTIYYPRGDNEIIQKAYEEGRIVLTSDTELYRRILSKSGQSILLPLSGTEAQLSHIAMRLMKDYGISYDEFLAVKFRLCSLCNGQLLSSSNNRWRCESCGQEYWVGGHWKNISRTLERVRKLVEDLSKG
ncbi:MAG: Mut7-C RNAse domain-containing protein [Nitrososphaerota archaeon]